MDEIDQVLRRLRRIEALERGPGGAPALLDELRQLVGEAEAWARVEGDRRAREAVVGLRDGIERKPSGAAALADSLGERPIPGGGGDAPSRRDATGGRVDSLDRAESREEAGGMR